MIPGCTHAIDVELDDKTVDRGEASNIYVTVSQGATVITVSGESIETDGYRLSAYLTQEQSLRLQDNVEAKVQVNWIYTNEMGQVDRGAAGPSVIPVGEQLLRRVLP
jgi:hypothetical protein